jgi:hypothetical protein
MMEEFSLVNGRMEEKFRAGLTSFNLTLLMHCLKLNMMIGKEKLRKQNKAKVIYYFEIYQLIS